MRACRTLRSPAKRALNDRPGTKDYRPHHARFVWCNALLDGASALTYCLRQMSAWPVSLIGTVNELSAASNVPFRFATWSPQFWLGFAAIVRTISRGDCTATVTAEPLLATASTVEPAWVNRSWKHDALRKSGLHSPVRLRVVIGAVALLLPFTFVAVKTTLKVPSRS